MSIAEKLETVADNMPRVFEAGKDSEYNSFWDAYVNTIPLGYSVYRFAGSGWKDSTFKPNKNLVFINAITGLFRNSNITNLKKCLSDCGVTLDTSRAIEMNYAFSYGTNKYLPKISVVSAGNKLQYLCGETDSSNHLVSIDEIEVAETNTFNSSFNYCKKLEHVIFTGVIATNGLDLHWSTLLDHESLLSIINCLKDYSMDTSGTVWKLTIGSENLEKLTEEEKKIAENKGWVIV